MEKKNLIILGILIVLIVLSAILFVARTPKIPEEQPEEMVEEMPAEPAVRVLPLASGEQIYNAFWSDERKFGIRQVIIDPLDVAFGQVQTVTVAVEDLGRSDITEEHRVTATVFTDNGSVTFSLEFIEVADDEQAFLSVWQGFWNLQDTYERNYQLAIEAFKEAAEHSSTITFR